MQTAFHPTLAPCWTSRKALKTWIAPDRTGPRRENAAVDAARAVQARCIFSWSTRASCTLLARSACVLWLAGDRPRSSRTMDLLHARAFIVASADGDTAWGPDAWDDASSTSGHAAITTPTGSPLSSWRCVQEARWQDTDECCPRSRAIDWIACDVRSSSLPRPLSPPPLPPSPLDRT